MKRRAFAAALLSFLLQGLFAQQNTMKPDARARAHLIYHPASKEILLINGYINHTDSTQNNVWKWNRNRWEEIVANGPGSIMGDAAALNSKTGEIIIFGGWGKGGFDKDSRNEVWSFNGRKWNKVETNFIDKHDHHKMVYADHLHGFVIYGGRNATSRIPDTTTWILKDGVFTSLQIPGPGASGNAGFAYDRERKKVVLFSAKAYNIPADLWEFDGQRWEKIPVDDIGITTGQNMVYCDHLGMTVVNGYTGTFGWDGKKMIKLADAGPSGANTALGYDPARKVILAYGGHGDNRTTNSSLWELENGIWKKVFDNGIWKQVNSDRYEPISDSENIFIPEKRWTHQMTYDEANNRVLLFGGAHGNKILGDMWAWNGSSWDKLTSGGPPARNKGAFAYDAYRKRAVLFGGSGEGLLDDTWEWDGKGWKQNLVKGPSARNHPMAAYDYKNKEILLFGGFGATGLMTDTWAYDGASWKQLDADGPKNCLPHGMIYDETREKVFLITLALNADPDDSLHRKNEMWEWTGSLWSRLSYAGPATSIRGLQALAGFGKNDIVLFDGDDVSGNKAKTWKFSEGKWTDLFIAGPSPRVGHSMIYDKSRGKTVLFGGSDRQSNFNDTWEWDGKEWTATGLLTGTSKKENTIDYLGQKPPGMSAELFAPGIVSTNSYEHSAPAFSPDGLIVLWTVLDNTFRARLLEMKYENGKWSKPARPSFADSTADDYYPCFSVDGKKLYFSSRRKMPHGYPPTTDMRIWEVERSANGWNDPVPVDTTVSQGQDYAHSITKNGTLYFSSALGGGTNWNIRKSGMVNGKNEKPVLLPYSINSVNYEDGPCIAPDESFIVFESQRPEGIDGSIDLYISFRNKDGGWNIPVNMGSKINSPATERFARLSPDGKYFFFGSNRTMSAERRGFDIYWIDAKVINELRNDTNTKTMIEQPLGDEIINALYKNSTDEISGLLKKWVGIYPNSLDATIIYSSVLQKQKRYAEAGQLLAANLSRWANDKSMIMQMALVKFGLGQDDEAKKLLEPILADENQLRERYIHLSYSLLEMGKLRESEEYFAKAMAISQGSFPWFNRARALARMGEKGKAFEALNKAVELRGISSKDVFEKDADLQVLRSDPRWKELISKMK